MYIFFISSSCSFLMPRHFFLFSPDSVLSVPNRNCTWYLQSLRTRFCKLFHQLFFDVSWCKVFLDSSTLANFWAILLVMSCEDRETCVSPVVLRWVYGQIFIRYMSDSSPHLIQGGSSKTKFFSIRCSIDRFSCALMRHSHSLQKVIRRISLKSHVSRKTFSHCSLGTPASFNNSLAKSCLICGFRYLNKKKQDKWSFLANPFPHWTPRRLIASFSRSLARRH